MGLRCPNSIWRFSNKIGQSGTSGDAREPDMICGVYPEISLFQGVEDFPISSIFRSGHNSERPR